MENILTSVLRKLGKKYEELSPQAKATFDRWESMLMGEPMTMERLLDFLKEENENLLGQMLEKNLVPGGQLDIRLKSQLEYGRLIVKILESPKEAAKKLEEYIKKTHKLE